MARAATKDWWEEEWVWPLLGLFGVGSYIVLKEMARGKPLLPEEFTSRIDPNQSPVDMYTVFHVAVGSIARRVGLTFGTTIAASIFWETWLERRYKDEYPEIFPAPSQDSPINSTIDTVAVGIGWFLSTGKSK